MTTGTFDRLDGAGNHKQFQVNQIGSTELDNHVVTDGLTGLNAQVANHTASNQNISSGVASLLVGAIGKLMNAAGVNFDAWRTGGTDAGSAAGVVGVGQMLEQEVRATSTSTVAASATSATLSVAVTAGFVVGAPIVLEPGAANAETALITAVVPMTSVAVQFPPGGALFTHTASYMVLTGLMNAARQAPGGTGVMAVSSDGSKATYRAGAIAQTLFSGAAAVLVEIKGSATKTVRIKKITLWAQAATKFYAELTLLRCTGLSAGTPVVANIGKHDTNDPAATAVVNSFAAAATAGSGSAVIGALPLSTVVPSATATMQTTVWDFCRNADKALILRGTGDVIEVFSNTLTLGTATFGFNVEFEEDGS
jgi:hypothetical protein